jgi:hypothetical protein
VPVRFQALPGQPQPPDAESTPPAEPQVGVPAPPDVPAWGTTTPAAPETPAPLDPGTTSPLDPGTPTPPGAVTRVRRPNRRSGGLWWAVLAAAPVLPGAILSGVPGALVFAGVSCLITALIAMVRGHLDWAHLSSRKAGGWLAGASTALVAGSLIISPAPTGTLTATLTGGSAQSTGTTSTASAATSTTPSTTVSGTTSGPTSATASATTGASATDPLSAAIASASGGLALSVLGSLPVRAPGSRTGYSRKAFGPAWADVDHNGCDTRNDVLRRDLSRLVIKTRTHGCVVASGTALDPYTGKTLTYRYRSSTVSVDHVVSLADMWVSGARGWSAAKRRAFANDPLNLAVVATRVNTAKGDRNAASWLPPHTAYRCQFVARQVAVKDKYGASVASAERTAMGRILLGCAGQALPSAATARVTKSTSTKTTAYYATCSAARAAGAAPLRRGRPGYRAGLDRDHDGVACE